jgi:small-conductance mechanosensitive channel
MPRRFKPEKRDLYLERMFETRSDAWERAGLEVAEVDEKTVKRAQIESIVLIPLMIAIVIAYNHQEQLLGKGHLTAARVITVGLLMLCGWALARNVGRALGPSFMRRMDPATAGTVGFLVRLVTIAITLLVGLHVVGVSPQALAVGGAFTAVILGLAAQQTLGNVFAGMVLLTARPFRVGERVRLQAGVVGGTIEGTVSSLGLLYTTLTRGYDRILIPNNVVLAAAIVPLKEPESVDVKVRLSSGVRPTQVQAILDNNVTTPTRSKATVLLEEVNGDEVVVRVQATPELAHDGAALADEIIAALSSVTGEHEPVNPEQTAAEGAVPTSDPSSAPTEPATAAGPPSASTEHDSPGDGMHGSSERTSIRRGPARVRE